jgi:hypothetical protein
MQGRRLPDGFHYFDSEPGDYWRQSYATQEDFDRDGLVGERGKGWEWCIRDPHGDLGSLGKHEVTEHEDGTITAKPSILNEGQAKYHGFLERGVWRSA